MSKGLKPDVGILSFRNVAVDPYESYRAAFGVRQNRPLSFDPTQATVVRTPDTEFLLENSENGRGLQAGSDPLAIIGMHQLIEVIPDSRHLVGGYSEQRGMLVVPSEGTSCEVHVPCGHVPRSQCRSKMLLTLAQGCFSLSEPRDIGKSDHDPLPIHFLLWHDKRKQHAQFVPSQRSKGCMPAIHISSFPRCDQFFLEDLDGFGQKNPIQGS